MLLKRTVFVFTKSWSCDQLMQKAYSIVMTRHCPDLGSASDWMRLIWVETRHHYGISAVVSQTSSRGKTSGGVAKWCWLFSQASIGRLGFRIVPLYPADARFHPHRLSYEYEIFSTVLLTREPASFWRENLIAAVILLRASARMSKWQEQVFKCKKFYHFAIRGGLNLL